MAGDYIQTLIRRVVKESQTAKVLTCAIGVTLLIVLLFTLLAYNPDMHGAATKEGVVDAYLQALERRDEQAILLLVPKTHTAEQAICAKVEQLGGHALREVRVGYRSEFGPRSAVATIQGVSTDTQGKPIKFREEIHLEQVGDRWYLILGRHPEGVPADIPSTRIRP